ncbi:MAG: cysteine--tRNA ligase [Patescibacteria group bacterium]|nr:cysteine--tRNA ligase [Patescibacteria group bacterium]
MLKLFDSLAKKKRVFKPLQAGRVTMYNCGPTVYDYVHIGNLRSFLLADLVRRFLDHRGFEVRQVMNITDVGHMLADADVGEDKLEVSAAKAGKTPAEVARFFTEAFFRDIDRLGVRRAAMYPRASEHVPEMIAMIGRLLEKGCAYKVQETDGGASIYFDVSTFPEYGRLSGNVIEGLNPGARVDVRSEKKHPADFALWIHNPKHLMQWETPWGKGYPGWHIECSAMSTKYLGDTIDIHTGGEDNKFPHHECEIAQAECATGQKFVRYWLHGTHLLVDGEKMSKSKGNFYTLDDLTAKGYEPRHVRYLLLSSHYRAPLNFTLAGLDAAKSALARLDNFADLLRDYAPKKNGRSDRVGMTAMKGLNQALDDDLNVAEALAAAFEHVHAINERLASGELTAREKAGAEAFMKALGDVFGFVFGRAADEADVPASVRELMEKRETARREKRFVESDRVRDEIKALGWMVEDTPEGCRVKRL